MNIKGYSFLTDDENQRLANALQIFYNLNYDFSTDFKTQKERRDEARLILKSISNPNVTDEFRQWVEVNPDKILHRLMDCQHDVTIIPNSIIYNLKNKV